MYNFFLIKILFISIFFLKIKGNVDYDNFKNFLHYFTGIEVDDSVFYNGHTTRFHKESILADYVSTTHLPAHLKDFDDLEDITLLNDTNKVYQKLTEIVLDKNVSPLLVDNKYLLNNTPKKTYLITTGFDILRDDGFIYAQRLRNVGLHVHHNHYENLFHGVLGLLHGPLQFDIAHDMLLNITTNIKNILQQN